MPGSPTVAPPAPAPRPASSARPPRDPRPKFVRSRVIEKNPPKHGEKPYEQLVRDAFDGPRLRLSRRVQLLEEAGNRKIRRGDAIDLIDATRRELEARHAVKKSGGLEIFFRQYAAFVACYVAVALVWCGVAALTGSGRGDSASARANDADTTAAARATPSQVHAAGVHPPFNQ